MGTHVSGSRRGFRFRLEELEDRTAPAAFTVTNALDAGPGSLQQAILNANAALAADTIGFDPGYFSTPRTITLTGGYLVVTDAVAITGPGASLLTVSGNNASREFYFDGSAGSFAASLSGMRLTAGQATADVWSAQRSGGAVFAAGTHLTLTACEVAGNSAQYNGGAIAVVGGSLTMEGCTVQGNTATDYGGGIYAASTTLVLRECTLSGNTAGSRTGGGIYMSFCTNLIQRCAITNNAAPAYGQQGGGIACQGHLNLLESAVAGNRAMVGAGISWTSSPGGVIRNSTVSGNVADSGGAGLWLAYNWTWPLDPVDIQNSTFTGNVVVFDNRNGGAGMYLYNWEARFSITGSIVAGNVTGAARQPDDIINLIVSNPIHLRDSAIGTAAGFTVAADSSHNLPYGVDLHLGPLADNGGPTKTHALLSGSPAIDARTNAAIAPGTLTDQRGLTRVAHGVADIGAFEVQVPVVVDFARNGTEDSPLPLSRADFEAAFSDPDSLLTGVRVVELPITGTLTMNGAPVQAGATIPAADLGGLAFQPAPDFFGAAAFRYTAVDEYGFAADPAMVTLAIAPVNDAPTVSAPGPQMAYEDVDWRVPPIAVGDVDSGSLDVTLRVAGGILTVATTAGLTVTGNGTRMVTLTGTAVALNTALASLRYRGGLNFFGTDALTVAVSDGSLSATAAVSIRVKSAAEQAADLIARIDALQAGGSLNHGQANALRAKLRLKGNAGDIDKVQGFLEQVWAFVGNGVLTTKAAAPLLEFGGILLLSVTRR